MSLYKTVGTIGALMLALALAVPVVHADERNQLSYLTFSQAIQIPTPSGSPVVLQPGTYAFRVNTGVSDPSTVRVYDKYQTHLYAQVPTNQTTFVATTNRDLTDHTVLTFAQGKRGEPLTLVKWYYVDRNIGHQFAYSGKMEKRLSEEEPVTVVAKSVPVNLNSPKGEVAFNNAH